MSGAEKLKEKIIIEANEQAEHVLNEARRRAEGIVSKAEEEAAARKKLLLEKARAQAEERRRRILTIAELEARKKLLAAKEELIEDTFKQALERLQGMETASYQELILPLLFDAAESGREKIIVSSQDRRHFTAEFLARANEALRQKGKAGELSLADESREMKGGFILREGEVEINCSFDSILRMQRDQLEPEVAALLFNE